MRICKRNLLGGWNGKNLSAVCNTLKSRIKEEPEKYQEDPSGKRQQSSDCVLRVAAYEYIQLHPLKYTCMENIPDSSKTTVVTRSLHDLFTLWSDLQKYLSAGGKLIIKSEAFPFLF